MTLSPSSRQRAKTKAQATIVLASRELERGAIDETAWARLVSDALAAAYLLDADPRWQSGFDGDPTLWREARELILAPVHRDGTFLDIGCATGHLMECLELWAAEQGRTLAVYGLELSPALAATARQRLPRLGTQVFEGNVLDWRPPHRFTFVHTGLEYAPRTRGPWLVRHLLEHFVEDDGRLITGPVAEADLTTMMKAFGDAGTQPSTSARTDRNGKTRYVVWCANHEYPAV